MRIFKLKISIIDVPKAYAILEVSDNSSFKKLHESIFKAFHRDEEHLYSFYLTMKDTKNVRLITKSPQIAEPEAIGFSRNVL